jgi:hypothetical protein
VIRPSQLIAYVLMIVCGSVESFAHTLDGFALNERPVFLLPSLGQRGSKFVVDRAGSEAFLQLELVSKF